MITLDRIKRIVKRLFELNQTFRWLSRVCKETSNSKSTSNRIGTGKAGKTLEAKTAVVDSKMDKTLDEKASRSSNLSKSKSSKP